MPSAEAQSDVGLRAPEESLDAPPLLNFGCQFYLMRPASEVLLHDLHLVTLIATESRIALRWDSIQGPTFSEAKPR